MPYNEKEYLGDSVYVISDGYGMTLTTENGKPDDPSNSIFIEPSVWEAMKRYIKNLGEN